MAVRRTPSRTAAGWRHPTLRAFPCPPEDVGAGEPSSFPIPFKTAASPARRHNRHGSQSRRSRVLKPTRPFERRVRSTFSRKRTSPRRQRKHFVVSSRLFARTFAVRRPFGLFFALDPPEPCSRRPRPNKRSLPSASLGLPQVLTGILVFMTLKQ